MNLFIDLLLKIQICFKSKRPNFSVNTRELNIYRNQDKIDMSVIEIINVHSKLIKYR